MHRSLSSSSLSAVGMKTTQHEAIVWQESSGISSNTNPRQRGQFGGCVAVAQPHIKNDRLCREDQVIKDMRDTLSVHFLGGCDSRASEDKTTKYTTLYSNEEHAVKGVFKGEMVNLTHTHSYIDTEREVPDFVCLGMKQLAKDSKVDTMLSDANLSELFALAHPHHVSELKHNVAILRHVKGLLVANGTKSKNKRTPSPTHNDILSNRTIDGLNLHNITAHINIMTSKVHDSSTTPNNMRLVIMDVGCGSGMLCGMLSHMYPKAQIVGIDRDTEKIAASAAASGGESYPGFIQKDLMELLCDEDIDEWLCETLERQGVHVCCCIGRCAEGCTRQCASMGDGAVRRTCARETACVCTQVSEYRETQDTQICTPYYSLQIGTRSKIMSGFEENGSCDGSTEVPRRAGDEVRTSTHRCKTSYCICGNQGTYCSTGGASAQGCIEDVQVLMLGSNLCGELASQTIRVYHRLRVILRKGQWHGCACESSKRSQRCKQCNKDTMRSNLTAGFFMQPCCASKQSIPNSVAASDQLHPDNRHHARVSPRKPSLDSANASASTPSHRHTTAHTATTHLHSVAATGVRPTQTKLDVGVTPTKTDDMRTASPRSSTSDYSRFATRTKPPVSLAERHASHHAYCTQLFQALQNGAYREAQTGATHEGTIQEDSAIMATCASNSHHSGGVGHNHPSKETASEAIDNVHSNDVEQTAQLSVDLSLGAQPYVYYLVATG
ncbi:hypothetical protein SARC_00512 [Sphaeroforma arctica JP610]|uniref:Methyltransferase domain-containing protein n=1 Tax=Sphaeroforma arctica JP610 TaxID=667725 RepID=A0A0L0GER8_9EUKA|nr:hypothetical protein SARC_00512 [Sphaeroforma arctica JP610]KNC87371.1 hypothetical protein SARC_00512 [Sphaeroforma arctica JP610]|eukprot:XP_014161273.1 hypothetical protein SARC_00512 [Sphaeroforma arctica JP610]